MNGIAISTKTTILGLIVNVWRHLSIRRRRHFVLILALMILSALAEVVSLGAVVPFLGILVSPEKVFAQPIVGEMAKALGIASAAEMVWPLTVAFGLAALGAGGIRMLLLWSNVRFAFASGADISLDVYRRTLYQPYQVHVARNSSEVISGIISKVNVTVMVLSQCLTLVSSMLLIGFVTTALLLIETKVALLAICGFGLSYGLITWGFRRKLHENSRRIAEQQTQVVKTLQEGLGGIRDVLLSGTQGLYCNIYKDADRSFRWALGINTFIGTSPRFAMEALGMILIAALAYGLSLEEGGVIVAMPILGALALGAQRMLPALQQGYNAWSIIQGNRVAMVDVIDLLDQPMPRVDTAMPPAPMTFSNDIRFEGVSFQYVNDGPWVMDDVSLSIPKGARVGFVGPTGSGKSTAVDVLMGLLPPSQGALTVDGQTIDEHNVKAWQQAIAHVPQSIYLADSSIAENIAFGIPKEDIDMDRVIQAARQAHIADFIESQPEGYQVHVGERGVRLSGGQRQRIGIARAFYKQASILVFDEATSALDSATEKSVMEAIDSLSTDLTIVIIAHRLSTVRGCDKIVELENGKLVAEGSYEYLLEHSATFRQSAQVR